MPKKKQADTDTFEQKLWKSADKLRKNIDAAEYKHIVLGLIFLKYISDAFEELHQKLIAGEGIYELTFHGIFFCSQAIAKFPLSKPDSFVVHYH